VESATVAAQPASQDAIAVLTADHRQLEHWFSEFQSTKSLLREEELAYEICAAIRIHMELDQEIFYPAVLEATHQEYRHEQAMGEHDAMRDLITEIERTGPTEDMFFAKVHVLCEMFSQHVNQEEKSRGVFFEACHSTLDLDMLGGSIVKRKSQLLRAGVFYVDVET
jgi:hypothetical protein